jgi:hypothetical protein
MAVKYGEFTFPSDFGFQSGQRKAKGGSTTPQKFAKGGVAKAPVPMGAKKSWNKDDAVSPGSPKRTAPSQSAKNSPALAKKSFAAQGENTPPATKQTGTVQRMSGWSDFKKGGVAKKAKGGSAHGAGCSCSMCSGGVAKKASGGRIANLGKYAHGGKVLAEKYEKSAGTPKKSGDGSMGEKTSGVAKKAGGGMTRAPSKKKEAAIHAKGKKSHGPGAGALAAMLGAAGGPPGGGMGPPGMGAPPPGMAPGPSSPPGGAMGTPPSAPPMGAPAMAGGGAVVRHVFVHHISHGK